MQCCSYAGQNQIDHCIPMPIAENALFAPIQHADPTVLQDYVPLVFVYVTAQHLRSFLFQLCSQVVPHLILDDFVELGGCSSDIDQRAQQDLRAVSLASQPLPSSADLSEALTWPSEAHLLKDLASEARRS